MKRSIFFFFLIIQRLHDSTRSAIAAYCVRVRKSSLNYFLYSFKGHRSRPVVCCRRRRRAANRDESSTNEKVRRTLQYA